MQPVFERQLQVYRLSFLFLFFYLFIIFFFALFTLNLFRCFNVTVGQKARIIINNNINKFSWCCEFIELKDEWKMREELW